MTFLLPPGIRELKQHYMKLLLTQIMPSLQTQLMISKEIYIFFLKKKWSCQNLSTFFLMSVKTDTSISKVRVNINWKRSNILMQNNFSATFPKHILCNEENSLIFRLSVIFIRNIFIWSLEILCSIATIMNRERNVYIYFLYITFFFLS